MNFAAWQQLSPELAAREIHQRVRARLSPEQRRAAIAWLQDEPRLAEEFARAKQRGGSGALAGVPFFAKDLFNIGGHPMFAGSRFLPEVRPTPTEDGAAVHAVRAAGGALMGTTQLHEFAYGVTGENPHYGDCEHPRFPGRTTGGSSSGSAAVVAAGIAPLALGSDTGGSVRLPAAFCGLFGFRLKPNDAWIRDAFPLATTFDTAGWFTASAADMTDALSALLGSHAGARETTGWYLTLPGLDDDVAAAFERAARRFAPPASNEVREALTRGFTGALDAYHTTVATEAWEAHASWADRFRDRYDPVVWQRLIRGRSISTDQRENAVKVRKKIRKVWTEYFSAHDFLILPASPTPALTKAECTLENRNRIIALTAPASIGGLPVLTIPVPLRDGLTTGLQIVVNDARGPVLPWALSYC